jgi:anti-sigma factor RsiW
MSVRAAELGAAPHLAMRELLPWFVMGSLDEAEHALVAAHVAQCAACQEEVAWHETVKEAHAAVFPEPDAGLGFAALRGRLSVPPAPSRWVMAARGLRARWRIEPGWARFALGIQGALNVALIATLALGAGHPAGYRALGRTAAAGSDLARLVVQFSPDTNEAELRRILRLSNTRLVDGPTAADAYVLGVDPKSEGQALQTLRAQKAVILVEALAARNSQ